MGAPMTNSLMLFKIPSRAWPRAASTQHVSKPEPPFTPSLTPTHQAPPHLTQLNHLHRTLRPVMDQAHDQVSPTRQVPIPQKIAALILVFHLHFLPRLLVDDAHRLDVR